MKPEAVHDLAHRDPIAAWPHVVDLIETDWRRAQELDLLTDLVYSEELPALIALIEQQAKRSKEFRRALLDSGPTFGGRGGPEMDRIFKLVGDAEEELATVVYFDDERELRSVRVFLRTLSASVRGKALICRRRRTPGDRE